MCDGCISVFLRPEQEKTEVGLMVFKTQEDEKFAMKQSFHSYKYYRYNYFFKFCNMVELLPFH